MTMLRPAPASSVSWLEIPLAPPGTRQQSRSNLDSTGFRVVRKGQTVACCGFHYRVTTVRLGTCYLRKLNAFGRDVALATVMQSCRSVQVIA